LKLLEKFYIKKHKKNIICVRKNKLQELRTTIKYFKLIKSKH